MKIEEVIARLRQAADTLAVESPDLADDERAWIDTLDGLTDGLDLAEWLAERALHQAALAAAAKERAKALTARAARFEADEERLRGLVLALVDAAGGKKVVRASMTLSPRNTAPKLIETDASLTPEHLKKSPPAVPDKDAIREDLKAGFDVPGWQMSNGGRSLAILTR